MNFDFCMKDFNLLGGGNFVVERIQTSDIRWGLERNFLFFVRQNKVIRDLIVAPELERISWNFCDRYLSLLKKGVFFTTLVRTDGTKGAGG